MPWATRVTLAPNFGQPITLPRPDASGRLPRGSKMARTKDLSQPPAPGCWILGRSRVGKDHSIPMVGCAATRRARHITLQHAPPNREKCYRPTTGYGRRSPATRRRAGGFMTTRPCALLSSSLSTVLLGEPYSPVVEGGRGVHAHIDSIFVRYADTLRYRNKMFICSYHIQRRPTRF
ncbi:hypothetical protein LX36DRAFT_651608 [Colletotrichum falcatum]|nr:hypothetical protein LX36DRAFT_651608 [Colletotrichum falcatum]